MVQKKRSIIIAAFDQSLAHTGIVVARYSPVRGPGKILAFREGPTKTPWALVELYRDLVFGAKNRLPALDVIVREDAYFSPSTPEGGLETERTGGWVEMLGSIANPFAVIYHVKASIWREAVWGRGMGWSTREVAKKHSMTLARAHGFKEGAENEHLADAFGILCWAGQKHFLKEAAEHADEANKKSGATRGHEGSSPEEPAKTRDDGQCAM